MGLPLVPMTVSWPADTKLFVRGTTATRKGHSAQIDARLLITVHVGMANFRRPDQPAETAWGSPDRSPRRQA
jgi:hypothetical protein